MKWEIVHLDETDSTNRWLKDGLAADLRGLTQTVVAVVADYQTAGRGCGSNRWESERGQNLLCSLLVHPESLPANRQFRISMAVSLALCRVVEEALEGHYVPLIKWPNDIYVGDRKICGILIENRLQGGVIKDCIIGVGLNVNQQRFVSDAPTPVSLANLTGRLHDREVLLQRLLEAFDEECAGLEDVRLRYLPRLYRREKFHRYRDAQGEFFARIATVEEDGRLTLETIDGHTNRYAFKEVQFVL